MINWTPIVVVGIICVTLVVLCVMNRREERGKK